jgi:hypothetical protein
MKRLSRASALLVAVAVVGGAALLARAKATGKEKKE